MHWQKAIEESPMHIAVRFPKSTQPTRVSFYLRYPDGSGFVVFFDGSYREIYDDCHEIDGFEDWEPYIISKYIITWRPVLHDRHHSVRIVEISEDEAMKKFFRDYGFLHPNCGTWQTGF